jgi:hypothetical protein
VQLSKLLVKKLKVENEHATILITALVEAHTANELLDDCPKLAAIVNPETLNKGELENALAYLAELAPADTEVCTGLGPLVGGGQDRTWVSHW